MANILFDIQPAKGHINATLKMAKLLKQAGHKVSYALPDNYWSDVQKHGFIGVSEVPVPHIKEASITLDSDNHSKYCRERNDDELADFRINLKQKRPDLVLLDEQNSYKAIYYQIISFMVIFFMSKPDSGKTKGIPPFSYYFLPRQTALSHIYVEFLWLSRVLYTRTYLLLTNILSGNRAPYSVCRKISKKYGINFNKLLECQRSFGYGVKGIPRLILSPSAFDFPHDEKPGVHRVGPLVDIFREGQIHNSRYETILLNIEELRIRNKGKIIYASMGTVTRFDVKRCTRFFLRIVKVARMNPDDIFILSTGKNFDVSLLLPTPDNMMVFESLPQVDLLQKCDIMFTHGGMNSITECVFCEVPVLVYPLSRHWDQPGNSARAVFHGLGLRGRIERDSAGTISRKLNKLKKNYGMYKRNVIKMKERFEEQNNSLEVVHIIESYIKD
jgi:UDP:flavonoid glycosyltransferase YjiC (YdhE family)